MTDVSGWSPVAEIDPAEGVSFWDVAEHLNGDLEDSDLVFLDELHGPIYLAYREDSPDWERLGRFDYLTDRGIESTDELGQDLPDGHRVVSEVGAGNDRHVVYVGGSDE